MRKKKIKGPEAFSFNIILLYFLHFSCCYFCWSEKKYYFTLPSHFVSHWHLYPWLKGLRYVEDSWACYDNTVGTKDRKGIKDNFIIFQGDLITWFHAGRGEVLSDGEGVLEINWNWPKLKIILETWQPPMAK